VFVEPPSGWVSESAAAVLNDPLELVSLSISGPTIVSTENELHDIGVFAEPSRGWSGTVAPSARLVASDGLSLSGATVTGPTVVADGIDQSTGARRDYVFNKPGGGWSGTLRESAQLVDSHGLALQTGVIDGPYVFAAAENPSLLTIVHVDVFSRPAGGWHGIVHQVATLDASGAPSASGRYVLSGYSIFAEPKNGWHGTVDRGHRELQPRPSA
jgi:hypothetical protein